MKYACTFSTLDEEVFDTTVCEDCKHQLEENCELLYSETVFELDGEPRFCDYCGG